VIVSRPWSARSGPSATMAIHSTRSGASMRWTSIVACRSAGRLPSQECLARWLSATFGLLLVDREAFVVAAGRELAVARPDAFLPDLAMSLNNQSGRLSQLGRREDALTAIDEALRLVLPVLERAWYFLPDAGLRLVRHYITRCQEAEREPNVDLVTRMHAVLVTAGVIEARA
jgi:hypothetical protein